MSEDRRNMNLKNMPRLGRPSGGGGIRFAPKAKPKNGRKTFQRLLKIFLRWKSAIGLTLVLTLVSSVLALFAPLLLGHAINTFNIKTNRVDTSLLTLLLVLLVFSYLASWFLDTITGVMMTRLTQKMVTFLRAEFFAKLHRIPLNFYDTRPHGDTMSRITNDVDNISSTISQTTTQLVSSIFSIIGSFVMMLILSPVLTFVAMIAIPLFLSVTKTIASRSRTYFLIQAQKLGALNGMIEENITGLTMVKAFNRQNDVLVDFKILNRELCDYSTKAQVWSGFLMPLMNVINNISFTLIASIGGVLVLKGGITVGVVVSFLTYSKQFVRPLNSIAIMFNNIQSALAGAERLFEIMDEKEELPDQSGAKTLNNPQGEVEFCKVFFSYEAGQPVLKNINFKVNPGEVVALVGETGAGKTTIVNLLTRFYEVDQGIIKIDNTDITEISRRSLKECFSVVLQDTHLFTGTIMDNIRYVRPSATDREVKNAAKIAHADEFINRLPKGYETIITGSSDTLSQGQKQLLAIARAILCDAPILILDEATSSVDTKTEKEIQNALLSLMKNRTSFLIAHRLSTIRDADKIIVLSNGEIVESGTHCELMKNKGAYCKMVLSQMGYAD